MATDFLVKQGKVMGGVRLVTDADVAHQTDLTNIRETGTTASQAISAGTYFYLNGTLVRAKTAIASGATFTLNTNYEVVTAGALNELNDIIPKSYNVSGTSNASGNYFTNFGGDYTILGVRVTAPSDHYIIPYYSASVGKWALRLKKWDDTTQANISFNATIIATHQ